MLETKNATVVHGDDPGDFYCEHAFFSGQQAAAAPGSAVATNGSGWPPLGQASGQGHVAVVKLLLAHGADANQTFSGGRTALMCAAQQGHAEVVTALLGGAADAAATINGQTAFDLAVMQDHAAVAALLAPRP